MVGQGPDGPSLGWIGPRPFTHNEADTLRQAARFAAAPLAALAARATLMAALEAYLGRRSAARLLAGPLRRGIAGPPHPARPSSPLRRSPPLSHPTPPPS